MEYPLALALLDFLPVAAIAAGLSWLIPWTPPAQRWAALTGGLMIVAGGALKAVWKTIVALGGPDLAWLANAQFALMGPGFMLLAWAVLAGAPLWAFAGLSLAALAAAALAGATWPLILLTVVATSILGVRLLLLSPDVLTRCLFGVNLLGTYAMGMLASRPEQTIALQWMEESLNSAIWIAFALGAYRLAPLPNRRSSLYS